MTSSLVRRSRSRRQKLRRLLASAAVLLAVFILGAAVGMIVAVRAYTPSQAPQTTSVTIQGLPPDSELTNQVAVMPDVRGLDEQRARQAIVDAGIALDRVSTKAVPHIAPERFVVGQRPLAGTKDPTSVMLDLPKKAIVPDLRGKSQEQAREYFESIGARIDLRTSYRAGTQSGTVLSTDPPTGKPATETVIVTIAAPEASLSLTRYRGDGEFSDMGKVSLNGEDFEHSLGADPDEEPETSVWLLKRRVDALTTTVGVGDSSQPGVTYRLSFVGDGKELAKADVGYGKPVKLRVKVAGVLRLEVVATRTDKKEELRGSVVMADPLLIGGAKAIATLEEE